MYDITTTRMLLTTAVLAAVAALLASGGANADAGPLSEQPSVALTGDSGLRVDRAVAAANEAYDAYVLETATAAREALLTDQPPSVGLTGDSALTRSSAPRPGGLTGDSAITRWSPWKGTAPAASSASDGVDWSRIGLGAGLTALLAAGIAGVVLTTRRRGGIALP